MKIDVSDIVRFEGASLDFSFNERIEGLDSELENYLFDKPADIEGRVENIGGILKLNARLKLQYSVKCHRCLKNIDKNIDIKIKEDIFNRNNSKAEDEAYFYEGNYLEIDDILKDNIILNLPMKQLCKEDCKGICPRCGVDLNYEECRCTQQELDSRMEILKKLLKDDN